jgi:hypothetical protein
MTIGPLTADENQHVLQLASPYCNRFFVHVGDGTVRLTFGEFTTPESKVVMRAAVTIPLVAAQDLALFLTNVLGRIAAAQHGMNVVEPPKSSEVN